MRNEEDKAEIELGIFAQFWKKAGISVKAESVGKGDPKLGEPDIYCETNLGPRYFELTEACAPEFAAAITQAQKSGEPNAVWGKDVSSDIIRKKLKKTYRVDQPIDLVLYVNGRTALPDDVLVPQLMPWLQNDLGPFNRIWLFGEDVQCIAGAC